MITPVIDELAARQILRAYIDDERLVRKAFGELFGTDATDVDATAIRGSVIEARCVICGCPACDHTPLHQAAAQFRYVWRAWYRHRLLQTRALWRGHT